MANANSLVTLIRGSTQLIDDTSILDGQLLFDEEKQAIYMDDDDERKDFSCQEFKEIYVINELSGDYKEVLYLPTCRFVYDSETETLYLYY